MKMYLWAILACACSWSLGAQAQWQWTDKDGRKVFSDLAPPPDIPQHNILQQPGGQRAKTAASAASAAPAAAPTLAAPSTTGTPATLSPAAAAPLLPAPGAAKDKELQQRKAALDAQEAARQKAEDAKQAAARADNCSRAQRAKTTYASQRPLRHTNAQGEMVWMDEAARATEMRRIQSVIESDCGTHP